MGYHIVLTMHAWQEEKTAERTILQLFGISDENNVAAYLVICLFYDAYIRIYVK